MDVTCSVHGRDDAYKILVRKPQEKGPLGSLDRRIILKLLLQR